MWYNGIIERFDKDPSSKKLDYRIEYDDGIFEWINIDKMLKYNLIEFID